MDYKDHNFNSPPYYPAEIAEALIWLGNCERECDSYPFNAELNEALYWIKAAAANPHESNRWRTLYFVLERLAESYERRSFYPSAP